MLDTTTVLGDESGGDLLEFLAQLRDQLRTYELFDGLLFFRFGNNVDIELRLN